MAGPASSAQCWKLEKTLEAGTSKTRSQSELSLADILFSKKHYSEV